MIENKEKLQSLIDSAWENFGEIVADEEAGDFSDARRTWRSLLNNLW